VFPRQNEDHVFNNPRSHPSANRGLRCLHQVEELRVASLLNPGPRSPINSGLRPFEPHPPSESELRLSTIQSRVLLTMQGRVSQQIRAASLNNSEQRLPSEPKPRLSNNSEPRPLNNSESRLSTTQGHVFPTIQGRVSSTIQYCLSFSSTTYNRVPANG